MSVRICLASMVASLIVLSVAARLWAYPENARQTKRACAACHTNPAGGAELTEGGKAYQAKKKIPADATTKKAGYVGSARCRSCHVGQHQAWSETPHSRALAKLASADSAAIAGMAAKLKVKLEHPPVQTEACVVCHVTGFKLAGGYPGADSAATASLSAVGCESCHGPGSVHVTSAFSGKKTTIVRAVSEKVCTQCHTEQTSPGFDFGDMMMIGAHSKKDG